ncbi:hypothetical protein AB0B50_44330 [Streptomyces sp. NPDC041068]|uniref:hypothetical protein n=1 Tax=Streptomyces sp. NPDC041068 TaxID=3155130 RepID=UPI0033E5ADC9
MVATRITRSQVARGVRHLRDVGDPADWIEYEKKQLAQILGRLTRMITGTLDPHLARYPDDEWAHLVTDQLTGVRCTLAQLSKPSRT